MQTASKYLNSFFPLLYYLYLKFSKKSYQYKSEGLHGSAIIFSRQYYQKYSLIFPEYTFLYGEEHFLYYRKIKNKLNFIFDFNITVYHNHSSSTKKISKTVLKKWKFQNNHLIKALIKLQDIYKREILI